MLHFHFNHDKLVRQLSGKEVMVMSRVCAVTGKKAMSGNRRSHSLRATRRKWGVNLQKVHVIVDGKPQVIRVSARAMKTLKGGAKAKKAAANA